MMQIILIRSSGRTSIAQSHRGMGRGSSCFQFSSRACFQKEVQVLHGDLRLEHGYVLVDICPCTLIQSQLPLRPCFLWCVCVCKMRQKEHSMRLYFKNQTGRNVNVDKQMLKKTHTWALFQNLVSCLDWCLLRQLHYKQYSNCCGI